MEVCFLIFDLCGIEETRMVCSEFNSYFVSKGAYINSPHANLYFNYLVRHERYTEIENLIGRGLVDFSHCLSKNKQGFILHICEKDCPCAYDPLFSQAINRVVVGTSLMLLKVILYNRKRHNANPRDHMCCSRLYEHGRPG
ncbi:Hypothetical protein BQ3484_205 [Cedratvirus A11]|uniref:Uncharacterized protein n=1 Tax=Cedratvirus A11 TaxID=1903266 RepID=A0A1M7XUA8_9VIRU|nr:Hypothetical protein BQ3484_205 [Cedratvirus A11]SHO33273.1 Hypothetical protein BQ3484_205 [Cedratvirus A11]